MRTIDDIFFDFEEIKTKFQKMNASIKLSKKFDSFFHPTFGKFSKDSSQKLKQVIVKNISNLSAKGVKNALNYIIKNSDSNCCENQKGEKQKVEEVLEDWKQDFSGKNNAKEAMHLIFSIDEDFNKKNLDALEKSVKETMQKNFYEYKYVMVKHTHQNNPHIHVLINKNNLYTSKKLHFKLKGDCKNFFNKIREDFKDSLNQNNKKFNYENRYKFEAELSFEQLFPHKQEKQDFSQIILENLIQIGKKISINEQNISTIENEIEELKIKQNKLSQDFLKSKNFKLASSLKKIHKDIKNKYQEKKNHFLELKNLRRAYENYENQRKFFNHQDYSELQKQEEFIKIIQMPNNNIYKNLSKSSIQAFKNIQSNLTLSKQKILENSLNYIKNNLIMFKIFNGNTSIFKIDSAIGVLNKDLNVLKDIKIDSENLKSSSDSEYTFKINKEKINKLIEYNQDKQQELKNIISLRFEYIRDKINFLENHEESNKYFKDNSQKTKEMPTPHFSPFLNLKTLEFYKKECELMKIKYDLDTSIVLGRIARLLQTQDKTKEEDKEFKSKDFQFRSKTDESNKLKNKYSQTSKNQPLLDLKKLNLEGFFEWYMSKKIIKDKQAYKMNLYTKIKNNELENFQALYKRFEVETLRVETKIK